VISFSEVSVDPEKVRAIEEWPEPKTIRDVRSFHGLTTFYCQFIEGFGTIMAPITDCLKNAEFAWLMPQKNLLRLRREWLKPLSCVSLIFFEVFEMTCDALGIGTGVLSQEGHPVACFSEKLNDVKQWYFTYDKKFYAVIQALHHWRHYLLLQEFVLHSVHEATSIYSQKEAERTT